MKKTLSALAIAAAGITVQQDANAIIAASSIASLTQINIGCGVPSGSNTATVYSIDNQAINATLTSAGLSGVDTVTLPAGVTVGATCTYALNQLQAATGITTTSTGKWVPAGTTSVTTAGATPVNLTIPGTGYSLQQFTFIAQ